MVARMPARWTFPIGFHLCAMSMTPPWGAGGVGSQTNRTWKPQTALSTHRQTWSSSARTMWKRTSLRIRWAPSPSRFNSGATGQRWHCVMARRTRSVGCAATVTTCCISCTTMALHSLSDQDRLGFNSSLWTHGDSGAVEAREQSQDQALPEYNSHRGAYAAGGCSLEEVVTAQPALAQPPQLIFGPAVQS